MLDGIRHHLTVNGEQQIMAARQAPRVALAGMNGPMERLKCMAILAGHQLPIH